MLSMGPLGTSFSEILIEIMIFFIQKNMFENVVCETAAILPRPQCDNQSISFLPEHYKPKTNYETTAKTTIVKIR